MIAEEMGIGNTKAYFYPGRPMQQVFLQNGIAGFWIEYDEIDHMIELLEEVKEQWYE